MRWIALKDEKKEEHGSRLFLHLNGSLLCSAVLVERFEKTLHFSSRRVKGLECFLLVAGRG